MKVGDKVIVTKRSPMALRGWVGTIIEIEDLAYESKYPTGEEPVVAIIKFENGIEATLELNEIRVI